MPRLNTTDTYSSSFSPPLSPVPPPQTIVSKLVSGTTQLDASNVEFGDPALFFEQASGSLATLIQCTLRLYADCFEFGDIPNAKIHLLTSINDSMIKAQRSDMFRCVSLVCEFWFLCHCLISGFWVSIGPAFFKIN